MCDYKLSPHFSDDKLEKTIVSYSSTYGSLTAAPTYLICIVQYVKTRKVTEKK